MTNFSKMSREQWRNPLSKSRILEGQKAWREKYWTKERREAVARRNREVAAVKKTLKDCR